MKFHNNLQADIVAVCRALPLCHHHFLFFFSIFWLVSLNIEKRSKRLGFFRQIVVGGVVGWWWWCHRMSQRNGDNDDRRAQKQKRDQPKLKSPKRFSGRVLGQQKK